MPAYVLGAQAYKYVPFGPVDEVMPFLVRRAQENGDVLGNAGRELGMLRGELARRLTPRLSRTFAAAA
jgi:proline dehydrogenase